MSTPKKNSNPAIEAMAGPITALVNKGKKEGVLQANELNNELAKIPCTVEQIEQERKTADAAFMRNLGRLWEFD